MQQAALARKAATPRRAAAAAPMMPMSRTRSEQRPLPARKAASHMEVVAAPMMPTKDKQYKATTSHDCYACHAHIKIYLQQNGQKSDQFF